MKSKAIDNSVPQAVLQREPPEESHELLKDREQLAIVRKGRWLELLGSFKVRKEIKQWAALMAAEYGKRVQVHENVVDWVTALYIVRYGENEGYWPAELSDADVVRAHDWAKGKLPLGVKED